jgi:hypothetical protein
MGRPPSRRWQRRKRLLLVAAVSTFMLVLFIGGAIWSQGRVSGSEFAPSHFRTRHFSFWEVPLLHLQLTPIQRTTRSLPAARYLRANQMLQRTPGPPQQWHLVRLARGFTPGVPGDADILIRHLRLPSAGSTTPFWETWSRDHPELAKELWPRIQHLAEHELYLLMPELLQLARDAATSRWEASRFAAALDRETRRGTLSLADDLAKADRVPFAREILRDALADAPDDPALHAALDALPPAPPDDDLPGQ